MTATAGLDIAPPFLVGIDGGTEALKAGVFDRVGRLVAYASASYATAFPQPGWAEQDPGDWWATLGDACRRCLADLSAAGFSAADIRGVCADATTCTLLPLDAAMQPLRPALLWMDVRASDQAQRITASGHPALRYALAGVSAEWMPPKTLWLKEQQPDLYRQTRHLLEYTDWLGLRLTGRLALNLCTATQRWFYSRPDGGWPVDFYRAIGLEDALEKVPADVLPLGAPLGEVTTEAAAHTGLRAGTPVFTGGADAPVGILGLDALRPGQVTLITGSSNVIMTFLQQPLHAPGMMGTFPDAVLPELHLAEAGQVSTGSVINWFRRQFAADLVSDTPGNPGSAAGIYRQLDEAAAAIPPGSGGAVVLETFQGSRSPHADALARGAIWGLSLHTTRAHVYRALLEGIAYGTKQILDLLARHGCRPTELVTAGGATRSPLFMQLYADVCGLPIRTAGTTEATLLGSAVVAAAGSGVHPSITAAAAEMARSRDRYAPDARLHEQYVFWAEQYVRTYEQLRPLMHAVAARAH